MASLKRQKENNCQIVIQTPGKCPLKIKMGRHFHENKKQRSLLATGLLQKKSLTKRKRGKER